MEQNGQEHGIAVTSNNLLGCHARIYTTQLIKSVGNEILNLSSWRGRLKSSQSTAFGNSRAG
eukprot:1365837-Amphidinium_carterae.1